MNVTGKFCVPLQDCNSSVAGPLARSLLKTQPRDVEVTSSPIRSPAHKLGCEGQFRTNPLTNKYKICISKMMAQVREAKGTPASAQSLFHASALSLGWRTRRLRVENQPSRGGELAVSGWRTGRLGLLQHQLHPGSSPSVQAQGCFCLCLGSLEVCNGKMHVMENPLMAGELGCWHMRQRWELLGSYRGEGVRRTLAWRRMSGWAASEISPGGMTSAGEVRGLTGLWPDKHFTDR